MKKIYFIILLVFILPTLTGCNPTLYHIDSTLWIEETVQIEIVACINEHAEKITISDEVHPSFDYQRALKIMILENEKMSSFIEDISRLEYHISNKSMNAPSGVTVVLHQKNNDMIVMCDMTSQNDIFARFSKDGAFIENIATIVSCNEFNKILNKYFQANND